MAAVDYQPEFPSRKELGPHWHGWQGLKHFFVFGASYCDIGHAGQRPHPTETEPLGIKWPGVTYAEEGQPNWVGYLVNEEQRAPLTFCYAAGGARVHDVKHQIRRQFLPDEGHEEQYNAEPAASRPHWAPWTADDSLTSTWVGINDVCWGVDAEETVGQLMQTQETLYEAGLRNFLFVNVPPLEKYPRELYSRCRVTLSFRYLALKGRGGRGIDGHVRNWNTALALGALDFKKQHPDSTVIVYSSHDTFTRILDNPTAYGFDVQDPRKRVGGILVDGLHPTTAVHKIIAEEIHKLVNSADD
ncbi:hypothetical protein BKA62DRAFT_803101 [Auriculariales sp. MPI-PUGE-AT-0066]|nr:hypothetical protein BKA62DRAFT_803101 [Auriculariales sp. MPI-PUGE-AT-0066]